MWTAAHLQKTVQSPTEKAERSIFFLLKPNDFPWGIKLMIMVKKSIGWEKAQWIRKENTYDGGNSMRQSLELILDERELLMPDA